MEKAMDDRSKKIAHFTSFIVFLVVWGWLIDAGAFREGSGWIHAGFFVQGASFAIGILTRKRDRSSGQTI